MTRGIEKALGLPPLSEVLGEENLPENPNPHQTNSDYLDSMSGMIKSLAAIEGGDHGEAMDKLHSEALGLARDIADMANNVDHTRMPRMYEVASIFFKLALDAKSDKRAKQLNTMKMALEQQKFNLTKKAIEGQIGGGGATVNAQGVVHTTRNALLAQIRSDKKDASDPDNQ